jgi:hypothetical protein
MFPNTQKKLLKEKDHNKRGSYPQSACYCSVRNFLLSQALVLPPVVQKCYKRFHFSMENFNVHVFENEVSRKVCC